MVTFSDNVEEQFSLNTYRTRLDITDNIATIPYRRGSTNTASALRFDIV